ncbi:hypothetical protein EDM68_00410 [Candidatus Uhrbacteria bacterium]|nr:MAG: hypothetical protein EDM68_00410 [Candidatus Uhrbacteria bacterium]
MRHLYVLYAAALAASSILFVACVPMAPSDGFDSGLDAGPQVVRLPDGGIYDPLEGTACTTGQVEACAYPCWSQAVRVCPIETGVWSRCTPDELHGYDTCAPAPCTGPEVCTTPCGNGGLRNCADGVLSPDCTPIAPSLETCDAGVMSMPDGGASSGTDAGASSGTDAGSSSGTDAGPPICGGCVDRNATRICVTRCGYAGGQTCGECLDGLCCHPLAPSLETCAAADPVCGGSPSGTDAGTGTMADAGAGVMTDAGSSSGTDAGSSSGTDAGAMSTDAGGVGACMGSMCIELSAGVTWCTSGTPEIWHWDNTGWTPADTEHFGASPFSVPIGPSDVWLNGSPLNNTVVCRTGTGRYAWTVSPVMVSAPIGGLASSVGISRVVMDGVDVTPYVRICWDSNNPSRDPIYHRFQIMAQTAPWSGCWPGTGS